MSFKLAVWPVKVLNCLTLDSNNDGLLRVRHATLLPRFLTFILIKPAFDKNLNSMETQVRCKTRIDFQAAIRSQLKLIS